VFFLVYVSAAVTWFSDTELRTLLAQARASNQGAGITGMLLYKDGNFMQVLEGEEPAVRALYARIAADRRHAGLVMLDSGHAPERQFADWSMAFFDLNAANGPMPAGYSDFLDTPLTGAAFASAPSRWWQMLLLFRQME
jgi:hypothetical protein